MNGIKYLFIILLLCLLLTYCGYIQTTNIKSNSYKVLAKLISFEGGDKIHFAKFKIIKNLSDSLIVNDTIIVGYYNYKRPDKSIDNVLLTIKKYNEQKLMNNYFICIDYDGMTYIQKAKIEYIDFDYWEGCETGKGDCYPLTFSRTTKDRNWFLIMPCGGTEIAITISGQNFNKELHLYHNECPPYLDLTSLPDGKYSADMRSCRFGGIVTFNLTTKK